MDDTFQVPGCNLDQDEGNPVPGSAAALSIM